MKWFQAFNALVSDITAILYMAFLVLISPLLVFTRAAAILFGVRCAAIELNIVLYLPWLKK